ncbi:MAG: tetratricopeptide repeat protein [Chloroflexi bacterium]|nr:tetratricopeptide repeat protein [Chloroflexota bacterium]
MQNFLNRLRGITPDTEQPSTTLTPAQQEMGTLLETAATALEQGYHETALETYERGLTLARTMNDTVSEEHFLSGIGAAHVALENYDAARPILNQALEIARELASTHSDQRALARCLNNFGSFYSQQRNWTSAQSYHQQALDAARSTGDNGMIALALENLAKDYQHQDNPRYAQHLLKEALGLAQASMQIQQVTRVVGLLAESSLAIGERAAAHKLYAQAVQLAQQTNQPTQQLRWLQALTRLEIENRNFTQAIQHAQAAENLALRLGSESAEFFMNSALEISTAYQMSGNSQQAEEYATRALAQARSTGDARHEAVALMRLGMAAHTMGDHDRAQRFLSEVMGYYEDGTLSDREEQLQTLLTLGTIAMRRHDAPQAQQFGQHALTIAKQTEDPPRQAEALHLLGNLAQQQGDHEGALGHWRQALNLLGTGSHAQAAQLRCDIASARKAGGDFKAALVEYEKALVLLNHIKQPAVRGLVLSNAATLYTEVGDIDTAQAFYQESIEIAQSLDDARAESLRLGNFGWFYALTGRPRRAIDTLEKALKLSRALEDTLMVAVQSNNLARTYRQLEDYETARALHKQAVAAATATDEERWLAIFQSEMGETLAAHGDLEAAEPLYDSALELSQRYNDLETSVRTRARLAMLYARTERAEQAAALALESEQQARKMHYKRGQADALTARGDAARAQGDMAAAEHFYGEARHAYTVLHDPAGQRVTDRLPQQEPQPDQQIDQSDQPAPDEM